jgi:hypothetical protein
MEKKVQQSNLGLAILASLTLGLAPFVPEPHILGKIRWIAGGAKGMAMMDWFDFLMHFAPFVWLGYELWLYLRNKKLSEKSS